MRFYRALLHLYPSAFRAEYGDELCAMFTDRRRDAASWWQRALLWMELIADVIITAAQSHWDIFRQDLRLAARTLARSSGFTITAILVAALGVGATTAAFSVSDHVLLRPLPFRDPDRLVKAWEDQLARGYGRMEPSPANYRDWKQLSTSFETLAAYYARSMNISENGPPERLEVTAVTAELLPLLGVQPAFGRLFAPDDDQDGATGTVLLSYALWQRRFAGDPAVLGRKIVLDDEPYAVIGVMPPDFYFPRRDVALWVPIRFIEQAFQDRANNYLHVIGKLEPGITLEQARAEMRVVSTQLAQTYPRENQHVGVRLGTLRDEVSQRARRLLVALLAASLAVMLISCANLANLLLARALTRRKELALRALLGAGRERLRRLLLTESVILAVAGGVVGILLATIGTRLLVQLVPNSLPIAEVPSVDLRTLAIGLLLTSLTAIGFGVVPALRASSRADATTLQEGSRGGIGGHREQLRARLVIAAVAASVVLSISSGLLIRALWRLQATDPGFQSENVLTLRTSLPMPKYEATATREAFYARVLSEVRSLPGVTGAAYISFLPMVFRGGIFPLMLEGQAEDDRQRRDASLRFVTPGFFGTLGIPVRRGRDVVESDTSSSQMVAVVSESFERLFWPDRDALGRRFDFTGATRTVVGIVGNVRVRGLEMESEPQVYLPSAQVPDTWYPLYAPKDLAIRSSSSPETMVPALRQIIARADPAQPISDLRMYDDVLAAETAPRVAQVRVLGTFAAIAFVLAGTGIYGLLSFAVSQRAQEIGVRMAMGAASRDILSMMLREGLRLAVIGTALGVVVAYLSGRSMESLLAGVKPWDVMTFSIGVAVSLTMTLAGTVVPAVRAALVDPMTVMRVE